jgi:twitching motility protein PilT
VPQIGRAREWSEEVKVPNPALRNLTREDKLHQVYTQMQVGQQGTGMQTMNQSLYNLYQRRLITLDDCYGHAGEIEELRAMIEGRTPVARGRPMNS